MRAPGNTVYVEFSKLKLQVVSIMNNVNIAHMTLKETCFCSMK